MLGLFGEAGLDEAGIGYEQGAGAGQLRWRGRLAGRGFQHQRLRGWTDRSRRGSSGSALQGALLVEEVEEVALVRLVPSDLVGGDRAEVEAFDVGRGEQLAR